nr:hypothetical protein [Tanacetum cinerariifolium]
MTSLANIAIFSSADNRPPMLEKDMYDSWKSRMELYTLNRQHRRMILESVESGPLFWPSIEENGVTRLKKYSELSPTEAIQADCDVKATNIILQGLPLKGESLRDYYLRFSLLLNDMNIYNMKLEQFQVNTKFLNTLPPEWSKFVTDVKLVRDLHTTKVAQLHAYLGQHEYHANKVRLMHERTSDPLALVALFQKGDDPIDAINHMMSFFTSVFTSRYPSTNNQLRTSSNPRQQATINNGRVTIQPIQGRQNSMTAGSPALQDDLILSVIEQLKTQVVNCIKINQDNKNVNEILTTKLERYKNQERILKEQKNIANASVSYEQSLKIEKLKHTLSEHLKEKESLEQKVTLLTNDFQKEESQNIDRELALEKQALGFQNQCYLKRAQQLKLKLYDGSVIEKSDAIVIHDSEETLLLAEESLDYAALNQLSKDFETHFVPQAELSAEQAFWSRFLVQPEEPNLSVSTSIVEVPKELLKVSMVNSSLKKL